MQAARHPGGPWPLLALTLAWLSGVACQLQQGALAPWSGPSIGLGLVLLLALLAWAHAKQWLAPAWALPLGCVLVASLGYAWTHAWADARLRDRLVPALEGQSLVIEGVIDGLPKRTPQGVSFFVDVELAHQADGEPVSLPSRIHLLWPNDVGPAEARELSAHGEALALQAPAVRAAERWRWGVRLKRPHALMNFHGRDVELIWFIQGIGALGTVTPSILDAERLGLDAHRWIERYRQRVRDRIDAAVDDPRIAGLLAGLTVGDQAAIDRADWDIFQRTGVAHLISISGLHITMFAWLATSLAGAAWRRRPAWCLLCPAPVAARWLGLAAASLYVAISGLGIPAQRTWLMLAVVTLLLNLGRAWPWTWTMAVAAWAVTLVDPSAWLQPGFWLSFVAVGLLLTGLPQAAAPKQPPYVARSILASRWQQASSWMLGESRAFVQTQARATVGLAPLGLICFQQFSLIGLAANLVAIPLVTLAITPLAMIAMVLGEALPDTWQAGLWWLAAAPAQGLVALMQALAAPSWASWTTPAAPLWAWVLGLVAAVLLATPSPWRLRCLGAPLLLPLVWPPSAAIDAGHLRLTALDVGQGTALLVETRHHRLLYDTGPTYTHDRNAGERVLLPQLQALPRRPVDQLVLSHSDTDHVGGAATLIHAWPVHALLASLPAQHGLLGVAARAGLPATPCARGLRWQWDGVDFEVLHPWVAAQASPREAVGRAKIKPNAQSCVLRVRDVDGVVLLLTGDIEAPQEQALVAAASQADQLKADVLVVAHHGSQTSTTAAWLDAVRPTWGVVQAGYRNRFNHPVPAVLARLQSRGVQVLRSDTCGAWLFETHAGLPPTQTCAREARRRYWQDRADPQDPQEPPKPESSIERASARLSSLKPAQALPALHSP